MIATDLFNPIPEEHNNIDEKIVRFKEKRSLRTLMPNKLRKRKFKIFSTNGISYYQFPFAND